MIYVSSVKRQRVAFKPSCPTKFDLQQCNTKWTSIWFNFSYLFVILTVSNWTRKWPFLWGPRLRSLAAINLTKVNGNSRSFGMLALQPVYKSNPWRIQVQVHTYYIHNILLNVFLPGPAPGYAVRGFSQRIGDGVQCSNWFDLQWVDLWISLHGMVTSTHHLEPACFCSNHIKTYHEWWALDQNHIMSDDADENPYDELWELLTCHRSESWLQPNINDFQLLNPSLEVVWF